MLLLKKKKKTISSYQFWKIAKDKKKKLKDISLYVCLLFPFTYALFVLRHI